MPPSESWGAIFVTYAGRWLAPPSHNTSIFGKITVGDGRRAVPAVGSVDLYRQFGKYEIVFCPITGQNTGTAQRPSPTRIEKLPPGGKPAGNLFG